MNYFKSALLRHKGHAVSHPVGFTLLLFICGTILYYSYGHGTLMHAAGYLFAVWLGCFITDLVVIAKPIAEPILLIKQPKRELLVIVACTLLGLVFLMIRFFSDWQHLQGWVKLMAMPLILFTFPIALAIIFLFVFKYKFKELGVNLNYWYLPLLLHPVWGGITWLVAREQMHFTDAVNEYGFFGFIFTGILGAALSEEFSRLLIQTRTAAASRNMCTGFFVASFVWSAMHLPVAYSQDPAHFDALTICMDVIYLMPLGFLWGYLTYRTRSMLPSIGMHGFNLWGLQNF